MIERSEGWTESEIDEWEKETFFGVLEEVKREINRNLKNFNR